LHRLAGQRESCSSGGIDSGCASCIHLRPRRGRGPGGACGRLHRVNGLPRRHQPAPAVPRHASPDPSGGPRAAIEASRWPARSSRARTIETGATRPSSTTAPRSACPSRFGCPSIRSSASPCA
jgi:hypothetical protein